MLIDNVYRGSTSLTIEWIEPGNYGVTFSRFGYAKLSAPMRVESVKTTEISGALIPLTGSEDITTSPPVAWILHDSINQGVSPISLPNMTVENHTLTAGKEGYITAERRVTLVEDQTTQISIILIPASLTLPYTLRAAAHAPATLVADFILILLIVRYLRRE